MFFLCKIELVHPRRQVLLQASFSGNKSNFHTPSFWQREVNMLKWARKLQRGSDPFMVHQQ